ncbi:malonate decarboxylase holo-ACP synthase [Ancylobacter oerskovii]|uniref:Malonate decarboxylase holo-ACP synthase n=1 Tax=Ancylobacter oerskovii TaxID=459519 RepID=A0ABW4YYW4_9HYPH|nr:malonate decarboxylase holo-ACP synthase [Ancylobacter oerskovii]MBS7543984.1 malonate decarboxylase holo-ACP synthase [Ancylobacter oerskovii]
MELTLADDRRPRERQLGVHDLLRLSSPDAVAVADPPSWLAGALAATPWVVVRRAPPRGGRVAVGIRGAGREERCAAFLAPSAIVERVRPEDLARRRAWESADRAGHPVMQALRHIAPRLDAAGLPWGIAGGAGFELATGRPVLREQSDLDLIVRAELPCPLLPLRQMQAICETAAVRVDVLVESRQGAVSLAELCGTAEQVLLRGAEGPRLVSRAMLTAQA